MFDNEQFLLAFTLQPDVAVVITVYISTRHKVNYANICGLRYYIRANLYMYMYLYEESPFWEWNEGCAQFPVFGQWSHNTMATSIHTQ